MLKTRLTTVVIVAIASGGLGYWLGHNSLLDSQSSSNATVGISEPTAAAGLHPSVPYSRTQLEEIRADTKARNDKLAGELLACLVDISKTRIEDPAMLTYDSIAVYHAIHILGECQYRPAISFLLREAVEHNLWIANPGGNTQSIAGVTKEYCVHVALIKIGPRAVNPTIDKYVDLYLSPNRTMCDAQRRGFAWLLRDDIMVGTAVRNVNERLGKLNLIPGPRDEVDALWELKRELTMPNE